jgi:hypothetical protein
MSQLADLTLPDPVGVDVHGAQALTSPPALPSRASGERTRDGGRRDGSRLHWRDGMPRPFVALRRDAGSSAAHVWCITIADVQVPQS